jgi:hypothetical protein
MSDGKNFRLLAELEDLSMIYIVQMHNERMKESPRSNDQTAFTTSYAAYMKNYKMIQDIFLTFHNDDHKDLFLSILFDKDFPIEIFPTLFWTASFNNTIFDYINKKLFLPCCLDANEKLSKEKMDLLIQDLLKGGYFQNIPPSSVQFLSSNYFSIMKRFKLVKGLKYKIPAIKHYHDQWFVIFLYWLHAIDPRANLLQSNWFPYSLMTQESFLQRVQQNHFSSYYHPIIEGEKLTITPHHPYKDIYSILQNDYRDE